MERQLLRQGESPCFKAEAHRSNTKSRSIQNGIRIIATRSHRDPIEGNSVLNDLTINDLPSPEHGERSLEDLALDARDRKSSDDGGFSTGPNESNWRLAVFAARRRKLASKSSRRGLHGRGTRQRLTRKMIRLSHHRCSGVCRKSIRHFEITFKNGKNI